MIHPPEQEFAHIAPSHPEPVALHDARDLTQGGATAQIVLDGKVYTLRITRQGKLILTK